MSQEILLEVLKYLGPFIAGGGLTWLFNFRMKKREQSNQIAEKEFESVEEIVANFTNRMSDLSNKLSDLMERNLQVEEKLLNLQSENRKLLEENKLLQEEIKKLRLRWEK